MINFNTNNSTDINSSFYDEQKLDYSNSNNNNNSNPHIQHIEQQEQHIFISNRQLNGASIGSDDQYNEISSNNNINNDSVTSTRNKRSILRRSHVVTPISSKSFSSKFTPNNTESVQHNHTHHNHHNHHNRHLGDPYEDDRNTTENHNISINQVSAIENNTNHIYNSINITNNNNNNDNNDENITINNNQDQEISSERTDRLIIRKNNELDQLDYNYRIFSTKHPLRLSKIKAFEQAEAATRAFFRSQYTFDDDDSFVYASDSNSNFYDYAYQDDVDDEEDDDDDDDEIYLDGQSNRNSIINKRFKQKRQRNQIQIQNQIQQKFINDTISNNDDNFIIQIPGLTKKETAEIFSSNTNTNNKTNSHSNYEINENNNIDEFNFKLTSPEKRLRIMNNAFTKKKNCDLFTEKILSKRVEDLKLDRIFQANPSFLNELNLREIEYWSNMNEEFEKEMNEAKLNLNNNKKINNLSNNLNNNNLNNNDNDNDNLKFNNLNNFNINSNNLESSFENEMNYEMCLKLSAQLSEELRRKIKNELNDEF
ncbi:unnamed protein product [[Candida] boidinii]|nr:unnamed protein product [[Candida] boidinii]